MKKAPFYTLLFILVPALRNFQPFVESHLLVAVRALNMLPNKLHFLHHHECKCFTKYKFWCNLEIQQQEASWHSQPAWASVCLQKGLGGGQSRNSLRKPYLFVMNFLHRLQLMMKMWKKNLSVWHLPSWNTYRFSLFSYTKYLSLSKWHSLSTSVTIFPLLLCITHSKMDHPFCNGHLLKKFIFNYMYVCVSA